MCEIIDLPTRRLGGVNGAAGKAPVKTYNKLVAECLPHIREIFPWDLDEWLAQGRTPLLVDVREAHEYRAMHIEGSINVPRGILESASEYGYEETTPELAAARDRDVVLLCRSGNRSALAAYVLRLLGFNRVYSLKTGLRGWNDFDQPLVNGRGKRVDGDKAEDYFAPRLRPEQLGPAGR